MKLNTVPFDGDRYQAHQLIERLSDGLVRTEEGRPYQWRLRDNTLEYRDAIPEVELQDGKMVEFDIDIVTEVGNGGKKAYILNANKRREWFTKRFFESVGIVPLEFRVTNIMAPITKNGVTFYKPSARFAGTGCVFDSTKVTHAIRNGVGAGKTYGFGLLHLKD